MGERTKRERQEEFWRLVRKHDGGCWLYIGTLLPTGYGIFDKEYVHRITYNQFVGPLLDGLVIDHLCRVRNCVNPTHLEQVTQRENVLRSRPPKRTHCAKGHIFSPTNIRWEAGVRRCAICRRAVDNARYARKKSA